MGMLWSCFQDKPNTGSQENASSPFFYVTNSGKPKSYRTFDANAKEAELWPRPVIHGTVATDTGVVEKIKKNCASVNGTTYVMVGGAGCDEMEYLADDAEKTPTANARNNQSGYAAPPGAAAFTTNRMAIGRLRASASSLYFRLLDSMSGAVLDDVTLLPKTKTATRFSAPRSIKSNPIRIAAIQSALQQSNPHCKIEYCFGKKKPGNQIRR
jgi:hypothetical protein